VPETTVKKGNDYPVGPVVLGFFVFVVIGSCMPSKFQPSQNLLIFCCFMLVMCYFRMHTCVPSFYKNMHMVHPEVDLLTFMAIDWWLGISVAPLYNLLLTSNICLTYLIKQIHVYPVLKTIQVQGLQVSSCILALT